MYRVRTVVATALFCTAGVDLLAAEHPLSAEQRAAIKKMLDETIDKMTTLIKKDPSNVRYYSRRGDAYLFRGRFQEAVADYEKMVQLNPGLEASHWRRGIAYFYAGQYKHAAGQFEIYRTFDDVDRENGIWRFFSQAKAYGLDKARQGLLKYKKDDREPFPAVYKLFAEKNTPQEILQQINRADIDADQREKRLFYAELYIGLNYGIHNKPKLAREHLRKAVANQWGPKAGFGPQYMWHVGRLHYELLTQAGSASRKKGTGSEP